MLLKELGNFTYEELENFTHEELSMPVEKLVHKLLYEDRPISPIAFEKLRIMSQQAITYCEKNNIPGVSSEISELKKINWKSKIRSYAIKILEKGLTMIISAIISSGSSNCTETHITVNNITNNYYADSTQIISGGVAQTPEPTLDPTSTVEPTPTSENNN